jgi:hypothetical protein
MTHNEYMTEKAYINRKVSQSSIYWSKEIELIKHLTLVDKEVGCSIEYYIDSAPKGIIYEEKIADNLHFIVQVLKNNSDTKYSIEALVINNKLSSYTSDNDKGIKITEKQITEEESTDLPTAINTKNGHVAYLNSKYQYERVCEKTNQKSFSMEYEYKVYMDIKNLFKYVHNSI